MRKRLGDFALELLPFCGVLFVGDLYFKFSFLQSEGFDLIRSFLGQGSLFDWAGLYASVLLESFLLPLLLLPLVVLPSNLRLFLVAALLELVFLAEIAAWIVYNQIGAFPTLGMTVDFARALRGDPALVQPTPLEPMQWVKFGVVLAGPLLAAVAGMWLQRKPPGPRQRTILAGLFLLCVTAGAVAAASVPLRTNYHSGHLAWIAAEFFTDEDSGSAPPPVRDIDGLFAFYEEAAFPDGVPPPIEVADRPDRPNVLLVVFETTSAADYPLERMPRISELARSGLVAGRHYSTSAFSLRADFSLYTSLYDGPDRRGLIDKLQESGAVPPASLPRILRSRGYETHFHFPGQFLFRIEEWMMNYLGFEEITTEGEEPTSFRLLSPADRIALDRSVFERGAADLRRLCGAQAPFFVAVRSMIGHSPLIAPFAGSENAEALSREEKLQQQARFHDDNVGLLLDALSECEGSEHTIVAITGDHGVRSKGDDPSWDGRFLVERTFHVPLVIHYPPAFPEPVVIDHITSHVDLTPTILALAGYDPTPFHFHGRPLFDPAIRDRMTMFLAEDLASTVGLHYRGSFFMKDESSGLIFIADRFRFGSEDRVDPDERRAALFSEALRKMDRVEAGWVQWLSGGYEPAAAEAR